MSARPSPARILTKRQKKVAAGTPTVRAAGGVLLLAGLLLVALNMRTALSSVSPLMGELRDHYGLSTTVGGLVTAIPVLFLGVVSPLAPILARRLGDAVVLLGALGVLVAGIMLRIVPGLPMLFVGGALVGAGIAVLNVLMPGVVKREFPHRVATMTGVYSSTMVLGAAVGAGASVPIESAIGHGWRPALGIWAVFGLVAAVVWLPQVRRAGPRAAGGPAPAPMRGLWRSRLAWMVTGFMGLQSLLFYVVLAWMPTILGDHGMSKGTAASVFAVSTVIQIPAALALSVLAGRLRDLRVLIVCLVACVGGGYTGLLVAPVEGAWLWAVLLGVGQGALLSLALTLIVLRSPDSHVAAQLSGMAQAVGYCLAAFGPLGAGALEQATGSWRVPLLVMLGVCVLAATCGAAAGRPGQVGDHAVVARGGSVPRGE